MTGARTLYLTASDEEAQVGMPQRISVRAEASKMIDELKAS